MPPIARRAVAPIGDQVLRHGYTATRLHQLAKLATNTAKSWLAMDYPDLMEAAWFAIVEHLYTAEDRPPHYDLVRAGQRAVHALVDDEMHHAGYFKYKTDRAAHGPFSSPAFLRFWTRPGPDRMEDRVIERLAPQQILPLLKPVQRDALYALALHDDYQAAADAVGVPYATFKSQVSRGRRAFLELWHEGETPHRSNRVDRRVHVYGDGRQR
ncbi:hypothetical protein [Actinomadura geliboluensis]|uniref:hypothetical protein n=1 Tax=Actinomadura geliboluensis TaxID=882440 RepID=UPI00368632F8